MAELKQHALLLLMLAILVSVKFIIVPVIDWQNTLVADIQLLEKRSQKVTRIIAEKGKTIKLNQLLNKEVERGNELFFPYQTQSKFKLSQQKLIESLLDEYQLKSQNIGWQTPSELTSLQVIKHPLQLRFSGKTLDVIKFIAAIEKLEKNIEIIDFNLSLKRQNEDSLGQCNGRVTLNFYVNSSAEQVTLDSNTLLSAIITNDINYQEVL